MSYPFHLQTAWGALGGAARGYEPFTEDYLLGALGGAAGGGEPDTRLIRE